MILPILKYPHPLLTRECAPVREVTPELRALAANMAETMYAAQGIGLAASQVGELVCMIVVDVSGPEERQELMALVNPKITILGEPMESEEGCLSVPEYRNTLQRASKVRCEATDLDGKPVVLEAEETLAVCLQHEVDHLHGTLFLDHLSRLKRSLYESRLKKQARRAAQDSLDQPRPLG